MTQLLPGLVFAHGFSWRKRKWVRRFSGRADVRFVRSTHDLPRDATLLLWGSATVAPSLPGARLHIVRIEDGFLRSVGLGADLVAPVSWIFDARGMYYDATTPSDLEALLEGTRFDNELLARAMALREHLVKQGLTKYNLGHLTPWQRPKNAATVVLVVGQVERDASLQHGAPGIRTNLALVRAVRLARPDAHVVYKPHPDVVNGLRAPGPGDADVLQWCDEVVLHVPIEQLLEQVDEVHVMTSQTGFEALLRGRSVVCYGQPFYAGYGLTQDMVPLARRRRRLSLDELVAGALIVYPVYVSRRTGLRCEVEQSVAELLAWKANAGSPRAWWRRALRPFLRRS